MRTSSANGKEQQIALIWSGCRTASEMDVPSIHEKRVWLVGCRLGWSQASGTSSATKALLTSMWVIDRATWPAIRWSLIVWSSFRMCTSSEFIYIHSCTRIKYSAYYCTNPLLIVHIEQYNTTLSTLSLWMQNMVTKILEISGLFNDTYLQ